MFLGYAFNDVSYIYFSNKFWSTRYECWYN
jgi:hypothetical protein